MDAIREIMLEDYLDIFRGENTRAERLKDWDYTDSNGIPYPNPFFDEDGKPILVTKPKIKYILVGEACPSGNKNYFYDVNAINGQIYLCQIYKANYQRICPTKPWEPLRTPNDKIQKLLDLALRGVLFLDLFPYAIQYSTAQRNYLNANGITTSFWNHKQNSYSLENRLNKISNLLSNDWDLCLVAPKIISSFIVDPSNGITALSVNTPGIHPQTFRNISACSLGCTPWQKIAISKSYYLSSSLISNAF